MTANFFFAMIILSKERTINKPVTFLGADYRSGTFRALVQEALAVRVWSNLTRVQGIRFVFSWQFGTFHDVVLRKCLD